MTVLVIIQEFQEFLFRFQNLSQEQALNKKIYICSCGKCKSIKTFKSSDLKIMKLSILNRSVQNDVYY